MSKVDRAVHGPGWGEVILGAILSLVLGIVIGAALLVFKPVKVAKELPKEPVPNTVYYIEGQRGDAKRAKEILLRSEQLLRGETVKVTEAEINSLAAAAAPATPAAKPGAPAPAPAPAKMIETGLPNVRLKDGVMQVGVPVTLNVYGMQQKLIAQARGGFERKGDTFVYDPAEIYLGSCPVQRVPFLSGFIRGKVLESQGIPENLATAWSKLTQVAIEGNTLVLSAAAQ